MTGVAERVRLALAGEIEAATSALRSALPGARVETWVRGSENTPYCATIGVSEGDPAGDEVIVITVSVASDGSGGIALSSDLAEGGGVVLREGPSLHIVAGESPALDPWLAETGRFLGEAASEAIRVGRRRGI